VPFYAHSHEELPERDWQTLRDHLEATAALSGRFADKFLGSEAGTVAGLLHDIGKYSAAFQLRLRGLKVRVDHSSAGARMAAEQLGPMGRLLAYVIAGHHTGLPDSGSQAAEGTLEYRLHTQPAIDFSGYASDIVIPRSAGSLNLEMPPGEIHGFTVAFFVRMLYSCLVDADYRDTEAFYDRARAELRVGGPTLDGAVQRFEQYCRQFDHARPSLVNHWRSVVRTDCLRAADGPQGMYTLSVPTGGGKTVSSLAFALRHAAKHGLDRVIYVIPYTSIIEQNAQVFRAAVGDELVLEHHSNYIAPDSDDSNESERYLRRIALAEENWDAPLVVTTNVQFFESLFSSAPSRCRKLHNIARSVVILDEAHMLPIPVIKAAALALSELVRNYSATVVLCSATQPVLDQLLPADSIPVEIVDDPEVAYLALKRVDVIDDGVLDDKAVSERCLGHRQVLVIVNTRLHARRLHELLGEREGHFHLSAAMTPADRSAIIACMRRRLAAGQVCRVVSTQLVEAGVDIDFPVVFRSLAGLDSIAQAAGRCNREGKTKRGFVHVFRPADGIGLSNPVFARAAEIAQHLLAEGLDPLSRDAIRQYFNEVYFYEGAGLDRYDLLGLHRAGSKQLAFPFREIGRMFRVIEDESVGVVIPCDDQRCSAALSNLREGALMPQARRNLQRYSVSVHRRELDQLLIRGAVEMVADTIPVLTDAKLYNKRYGLIMPEGGGGQALFVSDA